MLTTIFSAHGQAAGTPLRDSLYNTGWRFFRNDMQGGVAIGDWKWLPAEAGKKPDDIAQGKLPDDAAEGWQPFAAGDALFKSQPGTIWLRAVLPSSSGPHRTLHFSSPVQNNTAEVDAQLAHGIAIRDQLVYVFLNGHLLDHQNGGDFDVDLDAQWSANGPNTITLLVAASKASETSPLGQVALVDSGEENEFKDDFDDRAWLPVTLPHVDRLESYDTMRPYQGIAWYRKTFVPTPGMKGKKVSLEFQGAMQVADVWVNGEHRTTHFGGYLPFTIDLSKEAEAGTPVTVAVKVDSRDNNQVPPGKPIDGVDFEYYSGLYRDVRLHVTDPLHITDAIVANKPGGGGILVTYPQVSPSAAAIQVQAEVANESGDPHEVQVACALTDATGQRAAVGHAEAQTIDAGGTATFTLTLQVTNPRLWSPDHPNLYCLRVGVLDGQRVADEQSLRVGIRTISIDPVKGFVLNGERLFLSGANRHQYLPWIGGAVSDNAQYRDLWKLKNAGWNFVRLCHYPQDPAVMDACDELGLVAIVCEPGWQYWSDTPLFWSRMEQDIREMVRWHRNHPSAVFWEITINEAYAPKEHVNAWNKAVHEELPSDQTFTCGDTRGYVDSSVKVPPADPRGLDVDVLYPSWEKGEAIPADFNDRARLEREYGDMRVSLADGDGAMMRESSGRMDLLNYFAGQPYMIACALWSYMDYVRGYSQDVANCGVVDQTRFPKFSYFAYQSQRDPNLARPDLESGPMVFLPNYWEKSSPHDVTVFSNCEEVELFVNGKSIARKAPEKSSLPHPPVVFSNVPYESGELKAVGYVGGQAVATAVRDTPQSPTHLGLTVDDARRPLLADGADTVFVHAQILDDHDTVVPDASGTVDFFVQGEAQIVSETSRPLEGGVASILVRAGLHAGSVVVSASSAHLQNASATFDTVPASN